MISKKDFKKIHPVKSAKGGAAKTQFDRVNNYLWEIPKSFRADMRAPARVYASERIWGALERGALEQIINVSALPGIVGFSLAMPDVHQGYGFPIGGVAATRFPDGVISPSGIGFDINCGVRLLKTLYNLKEIAPHLERLSLEMQKAVPSGLGRGRKTKLSISQIDKILAGGAPYLVKAGYGFEQDIEHCESLGKISQADAETVSIKAKQRGSAQLGTLGSGNHFYEIQKVSQVFDKETAQTFGLFKEQVVIMIHTGSRGLGHQVCADNLKLMLGLMRKYQINAPDKELACLPFNSSEGQRYFSAMAAAANFAWANRHMIAEYTRKAWQKVLGKKARLDLVYDVAHNIAKLEKHQFQGKEVKMIVHRKGATRAFPPNHTELTNGYKQTGQPVLLPGSMGTPSYVLAGIEESKQAWHTVAHGAGRKMSRKAAMRNISGKEVVKNLQEKGILIKCHSTHHIAEEAPSAYKDVDEVVEVVHNAGLSRKVAKLEPLAVLKGE